MEGLVAELVGGAVEEVAVGLTGDEAEGGVEADFEEVAGAE
jgi:hypothetical protein